MAKTSMDLEENVAGLLCYVVGEMAEKGIGKP